MLLILCLNKSLKNSILQWSPIKSFAEAVKLSDMACK